jgi:hypothetical protein
MADLTQPERIAIVTRVNPSGDVLEDIRAGVHRVEEPRRADHQQLDRLFARLRDEDGAPRQRYKINTPSGG